MGDPELEPSEYEVRVVERRRVDDGVLLRLSQKQMFPGGLKVYNPRTGKVEMRTEVDVVMEILIPGDVVREYEKFSPGLTGREKILVLLALLGESLPTTAVAELVGVSRDTAQRLLWELRRLGLVEGGWPKGKIVDDKMWPYRYGPVREYHWMLTDRGLRMAERLMRGKLWWPPELYRVIVWGR
jgi:hypothetical protein